MDFNVTCPACGGTISLDNDTQHVTCPFCSRDFDVDLSEAEPKLTLSQALPKEYNPSLETAPTVPQPAELASPTGLEPVQPPVAEERPSYAQFEPPVQPTAQPRSILERMGKWLWVLILGVVLLCITCVAIPFLFFFAVRSH